MHARSCWERLGRRRLIVTQSLPCPLNRCLYDPRGGGHAGVELQLEAGGFEERVPRGFYETVPDVCQTWRAHQCVMSALTASPSATVTTHDLAWPRRESSREPGQPPYVNVKVVLTHLSLQSSQGKPAFTPVMVKRTLSARPCMPTTHT